MHQFEVNMDEYLPLRDVVFKTLRQAILKGELEPGERLMEIQLAERLGVSRTPIREAIRKLELEGLVLMIPRKGAEVARISEKNLRDVLETVTVPAHPEISRMKKILLDHGAAGTLMSGSGPTVFGMFKDLEDAEKACQALREAEGRNLTKLEYVSGFFNPVRIGKTGNGRDGHASV